MNISTAYLNTQLLTTIKFWATTKKDEDMHACDMHETSTDVRR